VQFVDGDCEVAAGWIERVVARLGGEPRLAVVCGRRREADPGASVYNRLCDMEWDTPIGPALDCGGDAMMRVAAMHQVGGFDAGLIAGEEPELCLRLRRAGWLVERLDAEMTRHDAAMTRFGQWWRRAVRAGYAYAEGLAMYGRSYPRARGALSAAFWAVLVPLAALLATAIALVASPRQAWLPIALAVLGYAMLLARIARGRATRADSRAQSFVYAAFCVLGKWAETQGMLTYAWRRARRAERRLIEYKG
jgi:GT2 family glycosyltransferase